MNVVYPEFGNAHRAACIALVKERAKKFDYGSFTTRNAVRMARWSAAQYVTPEACARVCCPEPDTHVS